MLDIALCQLVSAGMDQEANLKKGLAACEQAAGQGADIAILPELWQIGYSSCPADRAGRDRWQQVAIDASDPWVTSFRDAASELQMAILTTFLQRWPGAPRNTALLVDRHGRDVLSYAKVHTCDFSTEAALTPGDSFDVALLDTGKGPVSVGVMICYDREFPESARELMLGGAEVVMIPNACPMAGERTGQLRSRSFENMTAMALANYASPQHDGHSSAFDGMAFESTGQPRDHLLLEAGEGEGVFVVHLDLDALREYRRRETLGDAYRRPHAYRRIADQEQRIATFVRPDARRGQVTPHE